MGKNFCHGIGVCVQKNFVALQKYCVFRQNVCHIVRNDGTEAFTYQNNIRK